MEDVEQSQDELQSCNGTETPQEHHLPEQLALDDDSSEESKNSYAENDIGPRTTLRTRKRIL